MREVVIVSATRTPIGKYKGVYKETSAIDLGTVAVKSSLVQGKIKPEEIDQVIFGNVLQAGNGQNPARQVAIHSGIPVTSPATTVNEVCGSGLKAVILGKQAIQVGVADTVVVGGMENMTLAPLLYPRNSSSEPLSKELFVDSLFHDGLTDAFSHNSMGITAERVAETYHISREEQDIFALSSQIKASSAQNNGLFKQEITPVTTISGQIITEDEGIRHNSSLESLAGLRTVFQENGTVTAGNSSTINDGASALVLMAKDVAEARGISYLATLEDYTEVGHDPSEMGYAPYHAIKKLLSRMNLSPEEVDLFEINEAFASQSVAVARDLGLPLEKVNIKGGAIALGHPIGASGARILTTLVHGLEQEKKKIGVASLCVGGGIGIALTIRAV